MMQQNERSVIRLDSATDRIMGRRKQNHPVHSRYLYAIKNAENNNNNNNNNNENYDQYASIDATISSNSTDECDYDCEDLEYNDDSTKIIYKEEEEEEIWFTPENSQTDFSNMEVESSCSSDTGTDDSSHCLKDFGLAEDFGRTSSTIAATTPTQCFDSSHLFFNMDFIQVLFASLIDEYFERHSKTKTGGKSNVFFDAFRDIMVLTKMTCKTLRIATDTKNFWLTLHHACWIQKDKLGSSFNGVSFKIDYVERISGFGKEKLRANLFDMVLGETDELKRKRQLAVELSMRNAIQLQRRYVDVVFFTGPCHNNEIYVRRASQNDHPNKIQYLLQEDFEILIAATREMETKAVLETCYSKNAISLATAPQKIESEAISGFKSNGFAVATS